VFQPRYAPRRARLKLSLTRTVTSAAALAALALVCGPALERTGDRAAAAAAVAISTASPAATGSAAQQAAPAFWNGALPIRPSTFAQAPAGGAAVLPAVEAVPVGPPGEVGALGIPLMVLRAYHLAADQLGTEQPSCKLPWWLLAGIGHTESGHAESGRLTADGTTRGRILGPRLNGGIPGDAIITDTDHGALDGDTVYDRAVGPMQFIPSTWAHWAADGNADGKSDPSNIFDATLAAAHYLCADGRDLSTEAGLEAAVLSYNHSAPYLATVLAWGEAYRDGVSTLPDSPLPVVGDVTKVRPPKSSRPPARTTTPSSPAPGSSASQSSAPQPGGSPTASASSSSSASSGSSSPTASASPTCSSTSPSPTDSSSVPVDPATGQSYTGSSSAGTRSGLTGATDTGSPVATPSSSTAPSGTRTQSATAQSGSGQSGSGQSESATATDSSSASASPSSCAP
jgi:membrane-bound lytic murein transglycosylase B